ncbi:MAG: hypothetical protein R3F17_08430 [Planctomycetota bacterium]
MPKSSPAGPTPALLLPLFTGWLLIEAFPGSERLTIPGPEAGGPLPWREALWVLASLFAVIVPAGPMWRNLLLTSLGGALSLVLGNLPIPGLPIFLFAAILTGAGELRVGCSTQWFRRRPRLSAGPRSSLALAGLAQFTGEGTDPGDAATWIVVFVAACSGRPGVRPHAARRLLYAYGPPDRRPARRGHQPCRPARRRDPRHRTARRAMVRRFGLDLSFAGTWRAKHSSRFRC